MDLTIIGAFLVLIVGVFAIWGRSTVAFMREGIIKYYAMKAVEIAEFMVEATGETKFHIALQWASNQIVRKWGIPIADEQLKNWIDWAVKCLKSKGLEIKAETVLPINHPKIQLSQNGLLFQINKKF